MKKLTRIAVIAMTLCVNTLFAQKADFKSAFKYSGDNLTKYYHSLSIYPTEIGKTNYFWYSYETTKKGRVYYLVNASKGTKSKMFDNNELAKKICIYTHKAIETGKFTISSIKFNEKNINEFTFTKDKLNFKYNIKTKHLVKYIPKKHPRRKNNKHHPYWQKYSNDGKYYVYAFHHNLYLVSKGDTTAYQLTDDGELNHSYASQGRKNSDKKVSSRARWAGDSKSFYVLRQDRRKVKECWVINHLAKPRPTLRTYKFPMPGDKYVYTYDLHLFHPKTKKHIKIDISKYLDQEVKMLRFEFDKYPEYIYFTRESRTRDMKDLCRVDTKTGELFEIISEESKPYWMDQLSEVHILNGGEDIIWWSERTGWGQYYLYNNAGKLKNAITEGSFVACRIKKIDTLRRNIIFEGYGKNKAINPYYRQFYKANFNGSGFTVLTRGDGNHDINLLCDGRFLLDTYSRMDQEHTNVLRDIKGNKVLELDKPDLSLLYEAGWKKPELIKVKASDGVTDLYGIMYKPFNFDPQKKYPIISNVYPGPQSEQIPRSFVIDDNCNQSLAQLGFIVINIGHRGASPYRHKSYHNFGYGNLRDYALSDDKFAIEQLANRYSYIDIDRVGIYGHSGGGFMSTAAMLTYPDFYKVAVSASGNHDNNIYTQWWSETHHGVQVEEKNTEVNGEKKKQYIFECKVPTNIELAKNLKGHLCLITGDIDVNVHMANTLRMADALIKENKRFDLFVMPGKDHGLGSKYYLNLIRYYFVEHLLEQKMENVGMYDVE